MAFHGTLGKIEHLRHVLNATILKIKECNYLLLHFRQTRYKLLYLHLLRPGLPVGGWHLGVFNVEGLPI